MDALLGIFSSLPLMNVESVLKPPQKLLVVEDSEEDLFFLRRTLQKIGFNPPIDHMPNGSEAIPYLKKVPPPPRLILSDIKMPCCSGLEFLEWIRMQPQFQTIPIVMWSSSDREKDLQHAKDMGAWHY